MYLHGTEKVSACERRDIVQLLELEVVGAADVDTHQVAVVAADRSLALPPLVSLLYIVIYYCRQSFGGLPYKSVPGAIKLFVYCLLSFSIDR